MKTFERDYYAEIFNPGLASVGAAIEACDATVKKCDEILRNRNRKPRKKSK